MHFTCHALQRAKERLGLTGKSRIRDEALTAMLYGKRRDNAFIYRGVVWAFNAKLDTLKTVYPAA